MIILDDALRAREAAGNPVRVTISGAGFAAQGLIMQLMRPTPGLKLSVVANRTLASVEEVFGNLGITDYVVANNEAQLAAAVRVGRLAVTTDPVLAAASAGTDVLVEATGEVEHGARVVLAAIEARKHIVLVNAELDGTLGPVLRDKAAAAGVVLTDTDGDQPGVLMNLKRQVELWGFRPVLLGNIKSLLDHYRTPKTQAEFARNVWQRPKMITSFADGTKIAYEMATLANATGFGVMARGMAGPRCTHVNDAHTVFDAEQLIESKGFVDYIIGAEPSFGVFVLGHTEEHWLKRYMKVYKMGDGPLYTFYTPYHLSSLETPVTIARAALFADPCVTPLGSGPVVDVFAQAKRPLQAGDVLDGIGGFDAYGIMENSPVARAQSLLPMGLTNGAILLRDVPQDQPLTFSDVELPADSVAVHLWNEQVARFESDQQRRDKAS